MSTDPKKPVPHVSRGYWRDAVHHTGASLGDAFTSNIGPNIISGITVVLVAIPLNMAVAIACELPASVGLVTGAVAGILGAVLGGSRLQITGPEVALVPITFEIIAKHGFEGLIYITIMAGLIQIALGLARVGRLVHAIPVPVLGGFMAAVGIMVFDSQLPIFLGVRSEARMATELTPAVIAHVNWPLVTVGVAVVAAMVGLPKLNRKIPAALVALAVSIAAVFVLSIEAPMVRAFDGGFPMPGLPTPELSQWHDYLGEAAALALIASIDSLLCAVSVDARTDGPRTRTDQELVAQGLANIGSAFFGGMPVAAAVVRSQAAIEAGATSRLAPLVQSVCLLLVIVALGAYVDSIPLVALASILLVVGWRLIDWGGLRHMWRTARFEVGVFVATMLGILLTDFMWGVVMGVLAALVHFAHNQRELVAARRQIYDAGTFKDDVENVRVVHFEGPLFFASQARIDALLGDLPGHRPVVIDLEKVPMLDTSGATALVRAAERIARLGGEVWFSSVGKDAQPMILPMVAGWKDKIFVRDTVDLALREIAGRNGVSVPTGAHRVVESQGHGSTIDDDPRVMRVKHVAMADR